MVQRGLHPTAARWIPPVRLGTHGIMALLLGIKKGGRGVAREKRDKSKSQHCHQKSVEWCVLMNVNVHMYIERKIHRFRLIYTFVHTHTSNVSITWFLVAMSDYKKHERQISHFVFLYIHICYTLYIVNINHLQ